MKNVFKVLMLFVALFLNISELKSEIILQESFSTATMPTGWTTSAIQGSNVWTIRNTPGLGSVSGGYYAVFDDEALGSAVSPNEAFIATPTINCINHLSVFLKLQHYWFGVEGTFGHIEISDDGGTTWNNIVTFEKITKGSLAAPLDTIIDITSWAANKNNIQIRFRYSDGNQAGKYWMIDDIMVYSEPDVSVTQMLSPVILNCSNTYTNAENITVRVYNRGLQPISNIPITVQVSGAGTNVFSEVIPGPIAAQSYVDYTFASKLDMTTEGLYKFVIFTTLADEKYFINDTLRDTRHTKVLTLPYFEDFNETPGGWYVSGGQWEWGNTAKLGGSSSKVWATKLVGNYSNKANAVLQLPPFDFSNFNMDPVISYDLKYKAESSIDRLTLSYSLNNGASWTNIRTIVGESSDWIRYYDTLRFTNCNTSCVLLRFVFSTDYSVVYDGFLLDNFKVEKNPEVQDISVLDIHFDNRCSMSNATTIGMSIRNKSNHVACNVPVKVVITHPVLPTQTLTGIIPGPLYYNQRAYIIFSSKADLSGTGTYTLTGISDYLLDGNFSNDTIVRTIPVIINTFPYIDDFESTINNWVSSGNTSNSIECGIVTDLGGPEGNGRSWTTNIYGSYNSGEYSYLYSPRLDFSAVICPYIFFDLKMLSEATHDYLFLEYSLNNGASWTKIGTSVASNWYNVPLMWSGDVGNTYKHYGHSLLPLAGNSCVLLRFVFRTDGSVVREGFSIDNILIIDNQEDVGVTSIITPATKCNNSSAENVIIEVFNYGCDTVSNIPVNLTYSGPLSGSISGVVPGPIAPGASVIYTFPSTIDMSVVGLYTLTAYTSLSTDLNHSNDTLKRTVFIEVIRVSTIPHFEDFNVNDGYWQSGGTNNSWKYGTFPNMGGSGAYGASWNTNVGGTKYNNNEASWVISPIYDLSNTPDPIVEFDIKYETESVDAVTFQMSIDGGNTFTNIKSWSGNSGGNWVHFEDTVFTNSCDLGCVRFRFYFKSDYSVVYSGVAFDNFSIKVNDRTNNAEIVDLHFNNKCTHSNSETIGISIRNVGFNTICSMSVNCLITHPTQPSQFITGVITGNIMPNQRVNYVFPNTVDLSQYASGQYTLTGWVSLPGDTDHSNDTIVRYAPDTIQTYPYSADFDVWHQNWVSNGNLQNTWEIHDFNKIGGNAGYGKSWVTSYNLNYNNSDNSWVMSPILDFSHLSCPAINFDIKFESESIDRCVLQYSLNNGANWTTVGSVSDPKWYNNSNGWSGSSANKWMNVQHNLSMLAGNSCVLLRIYFYSDGSVVRSGFAFDNVKIWDNNPDVAPIALIEPLPNKEYCDRRLTEKVVIRFTNYGCDTIKNMPFTLNYTGPNSGSFSEIVTDTIPSGAIVDYVCTNTVNMSADGVYNFTIITNLPGDVFAYNDTFKISLNNIFYQDKIVNVFPHFEDFNADDGGWKLHASSVKPSWAWGTVTDLGTMDGNCWSTNLTGNYDHHEYSYLYSPIFDLTSVTSPYISFDLKVMTESADYMWLEYSLDGGTTFTKLSSGFSDPKWYDNGSYWCGNHGFNWLHKEISNCNIAGKPCVIFRFIFRTDYSVVYPGIAIDNFKIEDLANNVGAVKIINPNNTVNSSLCTRLENLPITVKVHNYSCDTLNNVPINFSVSGAKTLFISEIITAKIPPNSSIDYTFTQTLDMTTIGTYNFTAYTSLAGDPYLIHDTCRSTVNINNYLDIILNTFPYREDFNSGAGGWQTVGNTSFALGTFSKLGGNDGFGNSWVTKLTGNYNNGESGYVMSPIFDLSSLSCAWVGFDYKYNTESNFDKAWFEYSLNGGASWSVLGANGDYLNWKCPWMSDGGTNWIHSEHDITSLAGNSCVIFRFRFTSDGSINREGFAFDNFNIHSTPIDAAVNAMYGCFGANEPIKINIRNNNNSSNHFCTPSATITSINVEVSINGGTPILKTITGLNILPEQTSVVAIPDVFAPNNSSTIFVRISNPNGQVDHVIYNDTITVNTSNWPACNDHCKYAIEVYSGTTLASQTSYATTNPLEDPPFTDCQPMTYENTVWYFFRTDDTGMEVTFSITNTVCSPSSNGLQVNILKIVNDTCNQSDNIELACFNNGNTNDITYGPAILDANSAYLIVIDGYANNNCTFNINLSGAVVLPIELLNFDAKLENGKVKLNWTTSSEINNKEFVVQRIAYRGDGFEDVTTVPGSGNSNQIKNYSAVDESPLKGLSYYRIKQVDFDAKYSHSEIRLINNNPKTELSIHPNPVLAGETVTIEFGELFEGEIQLTVNDETGKLVYGKTYNTDESNISFVVPSSLLPGAYNVRIISNNNLENFLLIVL